MNDLIYVDLDDVLCETGRAFVEVVNRIFDREIRFEDISDFDLSKSFRLDEEELRAFFDAAHREEVLGAVAPVEGAIESLGEWSNEGFQIAVVTGRPPSTAEISRAWLEAHEVPFGSLSFVDKYGRGGDGAAATALPLAELARRAFHFAVEDSFDMARFLSQELRVPVALLDRPWNREAGETPAGVARSRSWSEVRAAFTNR